MKEIGGYFGLEQQNSTNCEYHEDAIALNTARNALVYLVRAKKISKIYIPYFLCDSISKVCDREDIDYDYYEVSSCFDFKPVFEKELNDNEYLYVVNYYGQLDNCYLESLKDKYKRIIVDNVQSFFQKPIKNVDTIYSCRKFFGVPDGAYLYTNEILDYQLGVDDSSNRMSHLYGRVKEGAAAHYSEFQLNDKLFEELELLSMSDITHNILTKIDYDSVRRIRNNNYKYIDDKLASQNKINVSYPDGPYAYPFYSKSAMDIRKVLSSKGIYIATLWPNVLNCNNTIERDYSANILPLPCDQRYSEDDMKYMLALLEELL